MFTRTEPKRGFAGKNTAMMTVPEPYTTCKTVGVWDIGGEVRDRRRMQQNQVGILFFVGESRSLGFKVSDVE